MAGPTQPDVGEMNIDATAVAIKPVAIEDRRKLLKLREDAESAVEAVMLLSPDAIARAGINPDDVEELRENIVEHRRVLMFLRAAERMADKLRQTALSRGHDIALLLGEISAQGRRRAKGGVGECEVWVEVEVAAEPEQSAAASVAPSV